MNVFERFSSNFERDPSEAKFFWSGGPVTVAERTYFASTFSGVTAFETDEGLVLVDSGLKRMGPALASMIRTETQAPVHTAIFTQGHVDHAYGLEAFIRPGDPVPRIIAHRAMPARFARYERTAAHNEAINARQFGGTVRASESGEHKDDYHTFGPPAMIPNVLYDQRIDITVGGVAFEVHHARGETDDHTWVFCPERGVLCPGDLFIWAVPNAGNPQKFQRYAWEWADALRVMAARQPSVLCPGHGGPVIGDAALIHHMLMSTADFLDDIVKQTLDALNDGSPPHVDIVHRVALPVSDEPWLQNVYDDAEFIIRNIIRYYAGWWSGRPSELKPPRRELLAETIAELAGGPDMLLTKARSLFEEGEVRVACCLLDYALEAAPNNPEVQNAVSALYTQRAEAEEGLMAQNLFRSAAAYAKDGRPFK